MTMIKLAFPLTALLLAGAASAAPAPQALEDRIAMLCSVSDVDLVGKRLARECARQVRAEAVAQAPEQTRVAKAASNKVIHVASARPR
jgi:hypothetical protein